MANLTPREILDRVRNLAQRSGAPETEAYIEVVNVTESRVRQGEVEFLTQSAVQGLGVRVFVDRKVGFAYTSDLRPNVMDELVRRTIALAGMNAPRDENRLPDEQLPALPDLELYDSAVAALRPADLTLLARKTEDQAFAADKRIQSSRSVVAGTAIGEVHFSNTFSPYQTYRTTTCWLGMTAIASDGTKKREGAYADQRRFLLDLNTPERIGRKAAERAAARLGAAPIGTTQAPVIFEADAAAAFWSGLVPAINASNVIERRSFFEGKQGKPVASPLVTLVDDGLLRRGIGTRPFDGEGVQQRRTPVIERGVLSKILHTATTARRLNVRLTGNASRSYDSLPTVGVTNLFLQPGSTGLDKMIAETQRGLLVTDLAGFGIDTVSGEYSQQVAGRWIEKGVLGAAVEGVTVAGRLDEMLLGIDAVGKDIEYRAAVSSPSLRFRQLTIAGS
ncbi:MAG TPA: TldD/PmbA family protein [Candidatus Eisenbacteria bacterium]|nr:TldD/PmbA family protein [Candidatus Eisenbacteria bacterium]